LHNPDENTVGDGTGAAAAAAGFVLLDTCNIEVKESYPLRVKLFMKSLTRNVC